MFAVDYSKAQEFASITDGTYETFVDKAEQDATSRGTDFMNIHLRIRSDFEQEFKNNVIFHRIYTKKADGKYPEGVVMNLAKQAGIPDGTPFNSVDDYLKALIGKPLKVTVKNEKSESDGKTYENLRVKRIEKSELGAMHNPADDFDDSDLPF